MKWNQTHTLLPAKVTHVSAKCIVSDGTVIGVAYMDFRYDKPRWFIKSDTAFYEYHLFEFPYWMYLPEFTPLEIPMDTQ